MKKTLLTGIAVFLGIALIIGPFFVPYYFNNLEALRNEWIKKELELHQIRNSLEGVVDKEVLHDICVVETNYVDLWLPFTLKKEIKELERKIKECGTLIDTDDKCRLKPSAGFCEAYIPKYYYDQQDSKCKEFIWGGCKGVVPFNTLEECIGLCEVGN